VIRFFRHYVPLNLLLLVLIEALILSGAIYAGVGARFFDGGGVPESLNPLLPAVSTTCNGRAVCARCCSVSA
jgi:hypothetical protein